MKKILQTCILICCLAFNSFSQELCGTDTEHDILMQTDPAYRNHILNLEERVRSRIQNQQLPQSRSAYIIPVVVHVIHLGEAEGTGSNISDAQIISAIDGINSRWRNLNGLGADIEVEFCLANADPGGNATTGINRVDGSGVPGYGVFGINHTTSSTCGGANPHEIKDLSRWPVTSYYNIWVVYTICGSIAGYASYPNGGDYDGTVIRASYMTNTSTTPTHELGHGFFLYHTFTGDGGDLYCPDDFDCLNEGDKVCDTQPHLQSDCGTVNLCLGSGTWDNSRFNYVSYCGTRNRYTQGQKERVQATLLEWPRADLLLNNICIGSSVNEKFSEVTISIYPNPATSELRIKNSELRIKEIEIYSSLGESVFQSQISSLKSQISIDVSQLPPGIYFITITDEAGNKLTKKVVKM